MTDPDEPEPSWTDAVRVRDDPALAAEIEQRRSKEPRPRAVGVTDLLASRRAFWRITGPPAPVTPERQARLDAGRFLHRQVEKFLAPDGALEVRVRSDGLVGRIDAVSDRPIELKTASVAVDPENLVADRPDHVEQLGMYCALLGRSNGRLVTVVTRGGEALGVRTYDVQYREVGAIVQEMHVRADRLEAAIRAGRPDGLPRCRWYGRGCEFAAGSICDCRGDEPEPASAILERVDSIEARPELDAALLPRLIDAVRTTPRPSIRRFRDLIYPRRAYFETVRPTSPPREPRDAAREESLETYRSLIDAVESGPPGEVTRLPVLADEPEEEVSAFRGEPFLLRTSRAATAPRAEEVVARAPQYALELGFRCAVTGRTSGRAIVSYGSPARARLHVFELEFGPGGAFARLWRQRARRWQQAIRDRSPLGLAPCPPWMARDCPYRSECGCAEEPGRSQR